MTLSRRRPHSSPRTRSCTRVQNRRARHRRDAGLLDDRSMLTGVVLVELVGRVASRWANASMSSTALQQQLWLLRVRLEGLGGQG
jgi:hypothetical protein